MTSLSVRPPDASLATDHDLGLDLLETVLTHRGGAHAAPGRSYRWFWISFLFIAFGALALATAQLLSLRA